MTDDERLKQTFEKLRQDDARRAPSFEEVRKRRARRTSPWAVVVPLASAVAAAAVLVVWCSAPESTAPPPSATAPASSPLGGETVPAVATVAEEAPLDFLLDVPGLRGAPDFDTSLLRGSLR